MKGGSAVASTRTDPIPAEEPGTVRQAGEGGPAVQAAGLAKSYGPTVALTGLDLHVAAGETVALLGPNEPGKSTTIGWLWPAVRPDRGQVQVHDRPPSRAVADRLVGAMLQDAGLMPGVRVGELLAMVRGLYPQPLPPDELVALAGLEPVLNRRVDRLSGGQAQRVRFAAAIAGDPQLLLLDEQPRRWMSRRAGTSGPRFTATPAAGAPCCSPPTTCRRPTTRRTGLW